MSDSINPHGGLLQGDGAGASHPSPPRDKDELAAFEAVPDESPIVEYVKVLYKRRWAAATVFLVVLISAVVHSFITTPVYEARTRLIIENDDQNVVAFKAVVEEGQPSPDYYQTQYGILQSRGLARRTIDELRLWSSPTFVGKPDDGSFRLGTLVGWFPALFRGAPDLPGTDADEAIGQSAVIDTFLGNLTVEPVRNSRLVDVKYRSTDAALAARIANQLAKDYIEHSLEYRFTASREASSWLAERLAEQRAQVQTAEAKIQRYREQNDAIRLEDRENIVVQKLGELNTAVTRAKMERLQKEAVEHQLTAIENDQAALETFPVVIGNAFIQRQKAELAALQQQQAQLSDKLGQLHPDMLKLQSAIDNAQLKLRAEIANVVRSVHTEYQAAVTQERSLVGALEQQKNEALAMNRKAIEYSVLAREVESGKQIYDSLLQRSKETGVAGALTSSNIRVVDEAERPRSAVTPQPRRNIMLAVFGGFVLAVGFAFFFEYVDSRIKSPEEITAFLGLPSLGMLPALSKRWTETAPLLNTGLPPNFSEMLRTIRTNILFSSMEEGPRTLVVTSTGPGEGKTMVASNLAVGFALTGQRVLLVDADMRRSRAHQLFNLNQEPGLSNILVGNAKPSAALCKTDVAGLWVLPAGRTPPNPAELLSSKRFKDLVGSLGENFDTIVIDTPPVMVVTDPMVIASFASGVIFVIGAEMTSRYAAQAALQQLHQGRARVIGAILNRVQLDKNGYYYSRYYKREYGAYYCGAQA
jgi:succinoglycan biosynthesis transport protein ExoP